MIKRIKISELDKENIVGHFCPANPEIDSMDFEGVVVNKPWGYEYLMFSSPEVSIWMLYIKKGFSTSTHCHPNKKTSLIVLMGEAKGSSLNEEFILKEKDGRIYEKGVFHTTEALSENGIFVMEVETPSNKTDLVRLSDKYKREVQGYTVKKNICNKTYNYHYIKIKNEHFNNNVFGKHKFFIREYSQTQELIKDIKELKGELGILLKGDLNKDNEIFSTGDAIDLNNFNSLEIISPIRMLFLHERKNLIKLSDFVVSYLKKNNMNDVFLVSGGNLMHLLESIRVKNMNYLCNHHEQASAMSAEGYSKLTGKTGLVFVTSGPGATNAITGVAGAWMDSNPMLIISGQSYSSQTIGDSGLRQLGVQEINIIDLVKPITKYAVMVKDPKKIKYYLDKAIYLANNKRPGPVWIDIPINIQLAQIQEEELEQFDPSLEEIKHKSNEENLSEKVLQTINLLNNSERPVILLGNGVRLGSAEKEFLELADKLSIPILTSRNANDLIWDSHPLYIGRPGSFGQRPANFSIQNADLLLSIGSRAALALTGWAYNDFARKAKKIFVDIDIAELKKPTISPDIIINTDSKKFINEMLNQLNNYSPRDISMWKEKIKEWKKNYPIVLEEYKQLKEYVNTYYFTEILSQELNENDIVITDMGMSFQTVMQSFKIKKGQRLFTSSGLAAMGFGLPGAIGACIANNKKRVICISGDGGLMMNLQELQTLKHYNLPIKLFIFNNKGYSSIRETQKNYFEGFLGSEKESGVSMPDFIKVAESFGLTSKRINNQENLSKEIREVLDSPGPFVCDINVSESQQVVPKQGAFNRPDGKTVPRPIEDSIPYLSREDLEKEMIIEAIPFDPYKE